jgi:tetratricopeptide (TPR) repeat protein
VALAVDLIDPSLPDAQKMVALYLKGPARPEIRLAYTRKLLDASRYADAREQMQYVTTHTPEFADAWLVRGSLELQDQQWNEAKASLKTYLERSAPEGGVRAPESERGAAQAYLLLAQIAEHEQDYEVALAYLDQVDSAQDGFRVEVRRAMILARQGKLAQARALIQGIEEDQPEDARAKISAEVQMLREFHLYPDVYQVLSQAVKRFAQDYDFIYDLAMAAEKIGKIDEMESLLRQVIAARPDYPHAYNALGYSLADRNLRLPEARQLIARALEFAPNDPYIVDSMGWVEFRSRNNTEALRLLQGAYKERPDAEIAAHLGEVLWSMGEHERAITVWAEGSKLNAENETLQETIKRLRGAP